MDKKELKRLQRKQEKKYNKVVDKSRGKDNILLSQGLSAWILHITTEFEKLDFAFSPKNNKLFIELKKYCEEVLKLMQKEVDNIPFEKATQITKNKIAEYLIKSIEKSKKNKYTIEELGIPERDSTYFQHIEACWDVLDKELCKDEKLSTAQVESLKMLRRYCKKLVNIFNKEVISDMKNRGLAV